MGNWGFRKTIRLSPGIRVTFGKKSTGISFGGKWFRSSINSLRGTRSRLTIPGSGVYYEERQSQAHKYAARTPSTVTNKKYRGIASAPGQARSNGFSLFRIAFIIIMAIVRALRKR